jgi:hypothetical protein
MKKFTYIPAHEELTGKKLNDIEDILAAYPDSDLTVYVLNVGGSTKPTYLFSHGAIHGDSIIESTVICKQTQTFREREAVLKNVIYICDGEILNQENDYAVTAKLKGLVWAAK